MFTDDTPLLMGRGPLGHSYVGDFISYTAFHREMSVMREIFLYMLACKYQGFFTKFLVGNLLLRTIFGQMGGTCIGERVR